MRKLARKLTHWMLRGLMRHRWQAPRPRRDALRLAICLNHRISRVSPFMQVAIDELEAIGVGRALLQHCPAIGSFRLYDAKEAHQIQADLILVKWPDYPPLPRTSRTRLFWLKNPGWAHRIQEFQERFDMVFSASKALCDLQPGVPYLPVACPDPALFRPLPPHSRFRSEVCFVGNYAKTGRPPELVERYLMPATSFDFAFWGMGWETSEHASLRRLNRGRLRPELVPRAYGSAQIVLLNHSPEHRQENMIATRVFEALACGAFVICDYLPALEPLKNHLTFTTGGHELAEQLRYFLAHPEARRRRIEGARACVLREHTATHRAKTIARTLDLPWTDESARGPGLPHDIT